MRILSRQLPPRKHVDLLLITKEKYILFTKHVDCTKNDQKNCVKLWFIDSFRFLAFSLDKLASFLSKDKIRILQRKFSNLSEENFNLLTRKGVFPYEYIDCRKIGGTVFTILRVVLQFNDRQHYIWERLRHQCVAAVFHPDTRWIAIYHISENRFLLLVFENFRDNCVDPSPVYYYLIRLHVGRHVKT